MEFNIYIYVLINVLSPEIKNSCVFVTIEQWFPKRLACHPGEES